MASLARAGWGRNALRTVVVVPVLIGLLSACGEPASEDQPAVAEVSAPKATATPTEKAPTLAPDQGVESDDPAEPKPFSHDEALAAGIAGDIAIQCVYTFDPQEKAGMELIDTTGWVTPVADFFLNADVVYWAVPQSHDVMKHVLGVDGTTYVWKVPDDGSGAVGDDPSGQDLAELYSRLDSHTSACQPYMGPMDIFEVPSGMGF